MAFGSWAGEGGEKHENQQKMVDRRADSIVNKLTTEEKLEILKAGGQSVVKAYLTTQEKGTAIGADIMAAVKETLHAQKSSLEAAAARFRAKNEK